jgi:hypothetical protein
MKYILILMLCSATAEKCFKEVKHDFLFEDYYSCITNGYKLSNNILNTFGKPIVNSNKFYVKFMCFEDKGENT